MFDPATLDSDQRAEAIDWLACNRMDLIDTLHRLVHHDIRLYKQAAAAAAAYGLPVRKSDTLIESMDDAMRALAELNSNISEWSNR